MRLAGGVMLSEICTLGLIIDPRVGVSNAGNGNLEGGKAHATLLEAFSS